MNNNYEMTSRQCDNDLDDPVGKYLQEAGAFREFGEGAAETEGMTPPTEGEQWKWFAKNDRLPSMADFPLKSGNLLQFYALEEDGLQSVLVVESSRCGDRSPLLDVKELFGSNFTPLDVFWALSLPGIPVPRILSDMFIEPSGDLACQQGWAGQRLIASYPVERAEAIAPGEPKNPPSTANTAFSLAEQQNPAMGSDLACNNSTFTSGTFLSSKPFIRLDKTPTNYSQAFQTDCLNPAASGQCWGQPRFKYRAQLNTLMSHVKICGRAVQNSTNNHFVKYSINNTDYSAYFGPKISCVYFWNGNWRTMKNQNGKAAIYTIPPNQTYLLNWYYFTTQTTAHGVAVNYAKPLDQFDFLIDRPGGI